MRLVFDENFSEVDVGNLRSFFQSHKPPRPLFSHVHELGAGGEPDDKWIPRLVHQESIVISSDSGKGSPRLPEVCKQHRKTHIIFSASLHKAPRFVKLRAIIVLWPRICEAWGDESGARYLMQLLGGLEHFRWKRKP
jgi:hypothetical protein